MYVVGYPKSGNTWLCYLLAYCLNAEYDDLDAPGVHPQNEYQRRYVKGGLEHSSYQNQVGKVWKTHNLKIAEQEEIQAEPIVYLVRDGRDVMVSYYYYQNAFLAHSSSLKLKGNILQKFIKAIEAKIKGIFNLKSSPFFQFLSQHISEWVEHIETWQNKQPIAIVRYEDLKTHPEATLSNLLVKLNAEVSPEIIKDAITTFDFERLSQRQAGEENKTSFYRKGIVGDWKNHFSAQETALFKEKAGKILETLGYDF